jgi:hypothetical protein
MQRISILLLLLWPAAAVSEETVSVYQLTGAIQCSQDTGVPAEEAADLLRGQGVKVMSVERRKLPQHVAHICGAPVGEANVMKVAAADWSAFLAKNPDSGGYGIWIFDQSTVPIYKYDGTLQCGMGHEISLEEMAKELGAAGIDLVSSHKDTDGLEHIGVCGASTGAINVYAIDRDSLPAAGKLGYRPLVTRDMTQLIKPGGTGLRQVNVTESPSAPVSEKSPPLGRIPLLW